MLCLGRRPWGTEDPCATPGSLISPMSSLCGLIESVDALPAEVGFDRHVHQYRSVPQFRRLSLRERQPNDSRETVWLCQLHALPLRHPILPCDHMAAVTPRTPRPTLAR